MKHLKNLTLRRFVFSAAVFGLLVALPTAAAAAPFTITSTLTGDGRPDNPDGLDIDVIINGDDTSNTVSWSVDLDMALTHPSAKLDAFYFNLVGNSANYSFADFNPTNWALTATDTSANGSGSAQFMFEVSDPPPATGTDVTNAQLLTFTATKLAGNFSVNDFLLAASACSNDVLLGCGQLGAHIQSLEVPSGSGLSDSGFALGNYGTTSVPEPASLLLFGTGLAVVIRRLRRMA